MTRKTSHPVLDHAFWSDFAQNFWERKPLVLRQVRSPLVEMDHTEVFRLLVLYANHCRKIRNAHGFKFFLDGERIHQGETLTLLPRQSDKSLLGYHKRMNDMFEDYCLVCDELLRVNLNKQALLSDFTRDLYQQVGFPNRFSEMGLYLGNYRKTPFGVHVDECGVFSFPVVGTKRFRIWEPSYVQKNPDLNRAFKYEKHKAKSLLLEAAPGDMTYWPSSSWHIAESDGSFTATWSLGVWVNRPHHEMIQESVTQLIATRLGPHADQTMTNFKNLFTSTGEVRELPAVMQTSLAVLNQLSSADFKTALLKDWMLHISKDGFKTPPLVEGKTKLGLESTLKIGSSPLLWLQSASDTKLYVACSGVLVEFSQETGRVLKLIRDLNSGKACRIGTHLKGHSATGNLKQLQILANAGAFNRP